MMRTTAAGLIVLLLTGVELRAQEIPEMPGPQKEHEWLQKLAGDWEAEGVVFHDPEKPPIRTEGTEHARMVGGFWLVAEGHGRFMDIPIKSVMTLGYNADKGKYVGSWIDSMTDYMWIYEGMLDDEENTLTLETVGPCPKRPGEMAKIREVLELKDADHKVFTSSMQEEDGSWTKMVRVEYRRKK